MGDAYEAMDAGKVQKTQRLGSEFINTRVNVYDGTMDFGGALIILKTRRRVARTGWNGAGQWLELQVPDKHSKMTLPYIYIRTVQGDLVPWLASQTDLLAGDWFTVD